MKLSEDMLFGHPVLRPWSDDWQDCLIDADFEIDLSHDDLVCVTADMDLRCPELWELVEEGAAGCGFYLVGMDTFEIRLVDAAPGRSEHQFNAHHFFGTLALRPVVWSREARSDFSSPSLHPEYGDKVSFPEAALLAAGDAQRFSVDRQRLKPFESIFSLASNDEREVSEIGVDHEGAKIAITVHPETKEAIENIRNDPAGRSVLISSVYLPAVMQVFSDISEGGSFEDRAWYRIFSAKCAAAGIDLGSIAPLRDAQRLLALPFSRIEAQAERLFS